MRRLPPSGLVGGIITQWYERKPDRLKVERDILAEKFPKFRPYKASNGAFKVKGVLETRRGNEYLVAVVCPSNYPNKPPKVFVEKPGLKRGKHRYKDGSLCLFYPEDHSWTPSSTLSTIIARAAGWLHAYETWRLTNNWPGSEVSH